MRFPLALALLVCAAAQAPAAKSPTDAPPLPAPTGRVVKVSSERQLQAAVDDLRSGTTILIAPGVYRLTRTLHIGNRAVTDVALRGATANRDDVVLTGPGMSTAAYGETPNGVWMGNGAQRVLIANLTLKDFYFHPVIVNAGTASPHFYNVRLADGGQQLLKSNPDAAGRGVDHGIVEYSVIEFTNTSRDSYTNGVDVLGGAGWIIRHNLFRNIRAPGGQLAGPTILLWRGARDTIVESNTFVNCQREIALGLVQATPDDHTGGVIRNNVIYRDSSVAGDAAINVIDSPGTQVLHNTVLGSGAYPNAIEYRFPDSARITIRNNLVDAAIRARDGATAVLEGNSEGARAEMFVSASPGDLHLRTQASAVRGMGVPGPGAESDWDGDARAPGSKVDIGADQIVEP
jgi:hypothetical protein